MPTQVIALLKVLGFLILFALGAGIFLFDRAAGTSTTAEAATYTSESRCTAYDDRRYYEYDTRDDEYDRFYRDDRYDRTRYNDRYRDRYDRRGTYYEYVDYEYGYEYDDDDDRFRERYYGDFENQGRTGEFDRLWDDFREAWDRVDEALYYDDPYGEADVLLSYAENELWEAETKFMLGKREQAYDHANRASDLITEAFRELR